MIMRIISRNIFGKNGTRRKTEFSDRKNIKSEENKCERSEKERKIKLKEEKKLI